MTKQVRLNLGCIQGKGRNITTARADLMEKAGKALGGSYVPLLISAAKSSVVAFLWRRPDGWTYKIRDTDEPGLMIESLYGHGDYATREEAERSARNHLAQWLFEWNGRTGAEVINHYDDRKDHLRWVEWQYRYKAWLNTGMTDHEAHAKACQCYEPLWPTDHTPPTLSADGNAVQP